MGRFNIFRRKHKALRAMMFDLAGSLQKSDFNLPDESTEVLHRLKVVMETCNEQTTSERLFIIPLLNQCNPELCEEFESCYESLEHSGKKVKHHLAVIESLENEHSRQKTGELICKYFNDFLSYNLFLMNKKEDILNKFIWLHYTDEQIFQTEQQFFINEGHNVSSIKNTWMLRSMNNQEIIEWIGDVKKFADPAAFEELLQVAEINLTESRWRKLQHSIADGFMPD